MRDEDWPDLSRPLCCCDVDCHESLKGIALSDLMSLETKHVVRLAMALDVRSALIWHDNPFTILLEKELTLGRAVE